MRARRRRWPTARTVALAAAIAATGLILSSCPTPTSWEDFSGVNLIAGRSFGATSATTGAPWAPAPGLTVASGGAVDFVRFEPVGDVAPPVAGEQVWRYEVVNLFKNGDFEDGTLGGWSAVGSDGLPNQAVRSAPATVVAGNHSMFLDFALPTSFLWTDLETQLVGGFPEQKLFAFHIDFSTPQSAFGLEINNGTTEDTNSLWSIERSTESNTIRFSFPGGQSANPAQFSGGNTFLRDPNDTSRTRFSIGGLNSQTQTVRVEGLFDNIRMVRSDQNHYLRLSVPVAEAGRPDIVSGGSYTFTLYVRRDPTAGALTTAPAGTLVPNRFAARHLSVGLDSSANPALSRPVFTSVRHLEPAVNTQADRWHQLTFTFSGNGIIVPYLAPGTAVIFDIVIEIGHFTGGSYFHDAGSVLLATPRLEWRETR